MKRGLIFPCFFRIEVDVFSLKKDIKYENTNLSTRRMKMDKIKSAVTVAAVLISAAKVIIEGLEKVNEKDAKGGTSSYSDSAADV